VGFGQRGNDAWHRGVVRQPTPTQAAPHDVVTIPGVDAGFAEPGDPEARALQFGPDIVGSRSLGGRNHHQQRAFLRLQLLFKDLQARQHANAAGAAVYCGCLERDLGF